MGLIVDLAGQITFRNGEFYGPKSAVAKLKAAEARSDRSHEVPTSHCRSNG